VGGPKTILLICHSFPPYPGIGGRRWAKFAKYLSQNGHSVKIIASENPFSKRSEWLNDVKNADVTFLPFNYPFVLKKDTALSFFDKLIYRAALLYVKCFGKGNYYDRSLFWEKQIIKTSSDLISKHKIKNVIVTCPPFHIAFYCLRLKNIFPEINLVTDFRDLWSGDFSLSGLKLMSGKRQSEEIRMEKEVLERSDIVLTVSVKMTNAFKAQVPKCNCYTLPNGFDEDDFKNIADMPKKQNKKITFVFTGTLYANLQNIFTPLIKALKKLKAEQPELYSLLSFNFYGNIPHEIKTICSGNEAIHFHGSIPLNEVYEKISGSDMCLLFLTDAYTFSLSTKFYEYVSQKKKMIVFSKKGDATDFIEQNNLGYWISPENCYEGLIKLIELHKSGQTAYWNSTLNISDFSVKALTKQLEKYLK
jgi:hypothetical protein